MLPRSSKSILRLDPIGDAKDCHRKPGLEHLAAATQGARNLPQGNRLRVRFVLLDDDPGPVCEDLGHDSADL